MTLPRFHRFIVVLIHAARPDELRPARADLPATGTAAVSQDTPSFHQRWRTTMHFAVARPAMLLAIAPWTPWGRIHFTLVAAVSLTLATLLFAWGIV
jgi:hypothetical protein